MEKKIKETRIISTRYKSDLEKDINCLLAAGYHFHDKMIITPFKEEKHTYFLYTQIMVKYEE